MAVATDRALDPAGLARLLGTAWHQAGGPRYQALAGAVTTLRDDRRLPPGSRLPSERDLASGLGLSRTTVAAAYATLRDAGVVRSRRGSGSVVLAAPAPAAPVPHVLDLGRASLSSPDGVAQAAQEAAQDLVAHLAGQGYDPAGVPALRHAVAARYASRGLPTTVEQVVATDGALHALGLLVGLLVRPGETVVVESPGYTSTQHLLRRAGARLLPVPVTPAGWDLDLLEETVTRTAPRLVVLAADFSNPTGALLDAGGRARVAALATRTRTTVVVDETFADLALDVAAPCPVPAAGPDGQSEHVVCVGSLSKSVWGGLRCGWVRGPAPLVAAVARRRAEVDHSGPPLGQLLGGRLLDGLDDALPERLRDVRRRRATLARAVAEHLPDWEVPLPAGGLSTWARLPADLPAAALVARAPARDVRVVGGDDCAVEPGSLEDGLRLPFTLPPEQLQDAVRRLARVAADVRAAPPDPAPLLV